MSNSKFIEVILKLILLVLFIALTAIKVFDLLKEETSISLSTKKRDVEIPTITICFREPKFLMNKTEKVSASQFIDSAKINILSKTNEKSKNVIENEEWAQMYFFTRASATKMFPCLYLNSPISNFKYPDYALVG